MAKNLPAVQELQETQVRSLGQEGPWKRAWQPTPVFLPGESHGQRILVGYSPGGHQELDTTEVTARSLLISSLFLSKCHSTNRLLSQPPLKLGMTMKCNQMCGCLLPKMTFKKKGSGLLLSCGLEYMSNGWSFCSYFGPWGSRLKRAELPGRRSRCPSVIS